MRGNVIISVEGIFDNITEYFRMKRETVSMKGSKPCEVFLMVESL